MTEETVEQFLRRRERELMARVSALRGQLAPVEAELAKVQRMRAVLPEPNRPTNALASIINQNDSNIPFPFNIAAAADPLISPPWNVDALAQLAANPSIASLTNPASAYANRTIKDLIIQALLDGFTYGANAGDLRSFILAGYGRNVDPGSLRTQLHRLKASGILGQDAASDTWNFKDGKRAIYARYDHPTSRAAMTELQDENSDDDSLLAAAAKLAWREEDDKK
jgi:hypothetical protein